ncbi:MAG: acyl carrier protein [Acidobacteriota bacterium]
MNQDKKTIALQILAEISGKPVAELRPEDDLVAHLGLDSPKALQLLMTLEERLDIEISDEQAAGLNSVGEILSFLED